MAVTSVVATAAKSALAIGGLSKLTFIPIMLATMAYFNYEILDPEQRPFNQKYLREKYDFIVVGGGSAGSVLANRLSEVEGWNILLLEAGGHENEISDVPLLSLYLHKSKLDWKYRTQPQETACQAMIDKRCSWTKGKVLGGSSVLNTMLYIRGNRRDYDQWESFGNPGWGYEDVLPYFKKSEDQRNPYLAKDTRHHAKDAQKQKIIKTFRKDYKYIEATQSFYKFHSIRKSWMNAKQMCALEGADLFYPENDDEAQAVVSFWNGTQCAFYIYVGISTLLVDGLYTTIDGKTVGQVYNNWHKCEPDVNTEGCIVLSKAGVYTDEPCFYKYPFICKKNQRTLEWNAPCGMPNTDYIYNESEGKCYKFHNTTMSWQDAYKICFVEQSHLAVINSRREKNYLLGLIGKPKDQYTLTSNETIHLGFHNRLGDGWQTVTGTPLENSGYTNWGTGPPEESAESMKKCGSMSYTGHLYDVSCDKKSFFICEHDVDTHLLQKKIESTTTRAH